jgi:hypothetical protein
MFRSQFSSQRVVAMRMLCGVLQRRDSVVALEAYSSAGSGEGHTSVTPPALSAAYEATVGQVQQLLCDNGEAGSSGDGVKTNQTRKLVVNCFLHLLCCSDLPVELPTLLLWALGTGALRPSGASVVQQDGEDEETGLAPSFGGSGAALHNPMAAKVALLRCVSLYLRSSAEEAAIDYLRETTLLWTANGCPRMPTPHARRPNVAYEQYMRECAERSVRLLQEDHEESQEGQAPAAPESVLEAFALQCRWSRIDALCSRSALVAQLLSHALTAAELITSAAGSGTASQTSASSQALVGMGREALTLLVTIVRQGGEQTVRKFTNQLVRTAVWRVVLELLSLPAEDDMARGLHCQWWRLLSEVGTRDRAAAVKLWSGAESLAPTLLRVTLSALHAPSSGVVAGVEEGRLALAFLRCWLAYDTGVSTVTELLLALKLQGAGLMPLDSPVGADVLLVLEQAAVTCAAFVRRETASLERIATGTRGTGRSALSQGAEEAVQAASALLSFIKQHMNQFEAVLFGTEGSHVHRRTPGAALSLLCAVYSGVNTNLPTFETVDGHRVEEYAFRCLAAEVHDATKLRGDGLIPALMYLTEVLVSQQRQVDDKGQVGSVDATALHVQGQCAELLQDCVARRLFSVPSLQVAVTEAVAVVRSDGIGNRDVVAVEALFWLQRFVGVVCGATAHTEEEVTAALAVCDECATALGAHALKALPVAELDVTGGAVAGAVCTGVFQWHVQRVQQASALTQLSIAASCCVPSPSDTKSEPRLLSFLQNRLGSQRPQSTVFFAPVLAAVTRSYVRYLVCSVAAAAGQGSVEEALVQHSAAQKYAVLLQQHDDFVNLVCDAAVKGFGSQYLGATLPVKNSLSDCMAAGETEGTASLQMPHLKRNWMFDVLGSAALSGSHLSTWLTILSSLHSVTDDTTDGSQGYAAVLAERVYALLKLGAADQANKWQDGADVSEDRDEAAVEAYRHLLFTLVRSALETGLDQFCQVLCQITATEFAQGPGMLAAMRRNKSARNRGTAGKSQPQRVDLDGVLELCEKLLDAALNQTIDAGVHGAALLVLASPCMPWAARQRVWAQLGEVGLVHLLEDRAGVQELLPVLLNHTQQDRGGSSGLRENAAMYCDMANALASLRCASDRQFSIVAVSVQQIARFAFASCVAVEHNAQKGVVEGVVLRGPAAHVLAHLQQLLQEGDGAQWLVQAVLNTAAALVSGSPQELLTVLEGGHDCEGDEVVVPNSLRAVSVAQPASSSGTARVVSLAAFFV